MNVGQMWKDLLKSEEFGQPIVEPEEIDEVAALLQKHRIDLEVFGGNLLAILSGGRSYSTLLGPRPPAPTSPSIEGLTSPLSRPVNLPIWMMAAFPDAVIWLEEVLSAQGGPETAEQILQGVYGIDPNTSESDAEKMFLTKDGRIKAKCYAKAIDEFRKRTNRTLEVAVQQGASSDMYTGHSLLNAMGEESNFTLIARNTAMAYLQLRRRYEGRFPDETIFMAASGAVDAMVYLVVTHQISEKQILALAVAAGNEADHLVEFVVNLESLLLSVDSPSIPASEVLKACRDQRGPIGRTVSEVLLAGVVKDDVANAVDLFMQDRKFRGIRNHLSISKR